jgi:pilus assembly protein Flp/PilA
MEVPMSSGSCERWYCKWARLAVASNSGATAVEYGVIAALIAVAIIGSLSSVGFNLGGMYNFVMGTIANTLAGAN